MSLIFFVIYEHAPLSASLTSLKSIDRHNPLLLSLIPSAHVSLLGHFLGCPAIVQVFSHTLSLSLSCPFFLVKFCLYMARVYLNLALDLLGIPLRALNLAQFVSPCSVKSFSICYISMLLVDCNSICYMLSPLHLFSLITTLLRSIAKKL